MLNTYYVMGAQGNRFVRCVGTMVMLLVVAKMDECGEAVTVWTNGEYQTNPTLHSAQVVSAYEWMREWNDADEVTAWEPDRTTCDNFAG